MNQQKFLRYQIFLEKQKNFFRRKNMYEYKFSDKQSDEISDKTAKIDDLFKKFDDIDSKFDFKQEQTSDGKLSLVRKEFERPTDEQIKESAENSLFDFKDSSLKKIENDFQTGNKKIDDNVKTIQAETTALDLMKDADNPDADLTGEDITITLNQPRDYNDDKQTLTFLDKITILFRSLFN